MAVSFSRYQFVTRIAQSFLFIWSLTFWHKRQRFSPLSALYLYAVALAASLLLFFFSLDLYRRGFERAGISLAVCSALIAVGGGVCLFA